MKNAPRRLAVALLCLAGFAITAAHSAAALPGEPAEQSGPVGMGFVVQDFFGGQILGYGVDRDGTRGMLSEYVELSDGNLLIATELFDPNTGIILGIVERETETQDNFVTLGVVGNHVGLRQIQHVQGGYVVSRTYNMMNPIQGNKFNGAWLPPIDNSKTLFEDIEGDQGNPNAAVMASSFLCCGREVFGSNVAANRFGPIITLTDPVLTGGVPPLLAYYSATNQAVLAQAQGAPYSTPEIALASLTTRVVTEFTGLGDGFVNGLAVDSTTGIACTTTETDNSAEFYNLATQTGFLVSLPVIGKYSGGLVGVDPVHHLFLITHPRPAAVGEIHVYDENGNLQESLDGFSMGPAGATIAVVPGRRMGFLQSPGRNRNMSGLQSFTY
jgi:hypothetical protein